MWSHASNLVRGDAVDMNVSRVSKDALTITMRQSIRNHTWCTQQSHISPFRHSVANDGP
jgi:hypothetical protein